MQAALVQARLAAAAGEVPVGAVVVLDESDKVIHAELVPELKQEPDYLAALAALG